MTDQKDNVEYSSVISPDFLNEEINEYCISLMKNGYTDADMLTYRIEDYVFGKYDDCEIDVCVEFSWEDRFHSMFILSCDIIFNDEETETYWKLKYDCA